LTTDFRILEEVDLPSITGVSTETLHDVSVQIRKLSVTGFPRMRIVKIACVLLLMLGSGGVLFFALAESDDYHTLTVTDVLADQFDETQSFFIRGVVVEISSENPREWMRLADTYFESANPTRATTGPTAHQGPKNIKVLPAPGNVGIGDRVELRAKLDRKLGILRMWSSKRLKD
jgi:hypothetical protein